MAIIAGICRLYSTQTKEGASQMRRMLVIMLLVVLPLFPAAAKETRLVVRALTQDAKFIGTSMSGMAVIIENADTGQILDQGVTSGTTGNTDRIIRTPKTRYSALSDNESAAYVSTLDIDEPQRIRVTVRGPIGQPQARAEASSVRWVLPGKHIEAGDGWLLIVPGFAVDILSPAAHSYIDDDPDTMTIVANVVMICGCPTEPGGTWDADKIEVTARVQHNGVELVSSRMTYAGETSQYAVTVPSKDKGVYEILVTAFDPRTGNAGIDRSSFIVR